MKKDINIYSEKYQVQLFEVTANNMISLSMAMNLMLSVSEHQLKNLDIGQENLINNYNLGWVITQYSININRLPKIGENIIAYTKATGCNKFFCYRDFGITDMNNNNLITVNSLFVIMNIKKRKIVPVPNKIIDSFNLEKDKRNIIIHFPKIKHVDNKMMSQTYHVRYFDIDNNKHVNNTHYFDWMQDTLGLPFLINHTLKQVNIKYEREVYYNDLITSNAQIDKDYINGTTNIITRHQILNKDNSAAEAEFVWSC